MSGCGSLLFAVGWLRSFVLCVTKTGYGLGRGHVRIRFDEDCIVDAVTLSMEGHGLFDGALHHPQFHRIGNLHFGRVRERIVSGEGASKRRGGHPRYDAVQRGAAPDQLPHAGDALSAASKGMIAVRVATLARNPLRLRKLLVRPARCRAVKWFGHKHRFDRRVVQRLKRELPQ